MTGRAPGPSGPGRPPPAGDRRPAHAMTMRLVMRSQHIRLAGQHLNHAVSGECLKKASRWIRVGAAADWGYAEVAEVEAE